MTTNRIGEMTEAELRKLLREEFRSLIHEAVQEALDANIDEDDFDESTNFKPEVAEQLKRFLEERPRGKSVDDVVKELGLND